jgi:hypothetical protein
MDTGRNSFLCFGHIFVGFNKLATYSVLNQIKDAEGSRRDQTASMYLSSKKIVTGSTSSSSICRTKKITLANSKVMLTCEQLDIVFRTRTQNSDTK